MNVFRMMFILFLFFLAGLHNSAISSSLFTKDCSRETQKHYVKAVFDGDTILVETKRQEAGKTRLIAPQEKIRLLGIDAFEHEQNEYGKKGKEFLTKLVLNKNVCVETDVQGKDIYGRTLGYVFLIEQKDVIARSEATKQSPKREKISEIASSGLKPFLAMTSNQIFINEELLKNGLAVLYDFPPNVRYIEKLKKAQIYARQNMFGVWEKENYIKELPAQWRHKHFKKKYKVKRLLI